MRPEAIQLDVEPVVPADGHQGYQYVRDAELEEVGAERVRRQRKLLLPIFHLRHVAEAAFEVADDAGGFIFHFVELFLDVFAFLLEDAFDVIEYLLRL